MTEDIKKRVRNSVNEFILEHPNYFASNKANKAGMLISLVEYSLPLYNIAEEIMDFDDTRKIFVNIILGRSNMIVRVNILYGFVVEYYDDHTFKIISYFDDRNFKFTKNRGYFESNRYHADKVKFHHIKDDITYFFNRIVTAETYRLL